MTAFDLDIKLIEIALENVDNVGAEGREGQCEFGDRYREVLTVEKKKKLDEDVSKDLSTFFSFLVPFVIYSRGSISKSSQIYNITIDRVNGQSN